MLLVSNCDLPTNRMNWNRLLISLAAKVSGLYPYETHILFRLSEEYW